MNTRLDHLISRLGAAGPDHSLDHFEAEVGRAIARRRADARVASALGPVRLASVGLALIIGAATGAVTSAGSITGARSSGLFSVAADMAPSTLLEGTR